MNGSQLPMLIFLMLCQRKLNKPDVHPWTVCIDWRIMFSNYFQPLSQKVSIKDQFPGVEDRYNIYFTKGIYFLLLLWKELLFIHTTGCMFLFYKKESLLLLFLQLRESPGILSKLLEIPGIWINFFDGNHGISNSHQACLDYICGYWYITFVGRTTLLGVNNLA